MQVVQCDGPRCDKLGSQDAPGWFVLVQLPGQGAKTILSMITGPEAGVAGTFCSLPCVAEYATARALTDSVDAGEGQ